MITEIEVVRSGYADHVVNEKLSVYLELEGINSEDDKLGKKKKIDELKKYVNLALFLKIHFNIASNKYKKVANNAICIFTQSFKFVAKHFELHYFLLLKELVLLSKPIIMFFFLCGIQYNLNL